MVVEDGDGVAAEAASEAETVRALLTRWLAEDAALAERERRPEPRATVAGEMSRWYGLPPQRRAVVTERLMALHTLRSSPERGAVTRVARELSIGRANLYRILARMGDIGPVTGLDTGRRAKVASSVARDGFGEPIDGWIADALAETPSATSSDVRRSLRERARLAGVEIDLPEPSSLRRRVQRLRASVPSGVEPVGKDLLVDTVLLTVEYDASEHFGSKGIAMLMALVMDRSTRLILGCGPTDGGPARALDAALDDTADRLPALAEAGVPIAEELGEVDWLVPGFAASVAAMVGARLPADRRPRFRLVPGDGADRSRAGVAAQRLVGEDLGPWRLRSIRMSEVVFDEPVSEEGPILGFDDLAGARGAIRDEIDRWNESRLTLIAKVGTRGRSRMIERAAAMADDLRTAFADVVGRGNEAPTAA